MFVLLQRLAELMIDQLKLNYLETFVVIMWECRFFFLFFAEYLKLKFAFLEFLIHLLHFIQGFSAWLFSLKQNPFTN